MAFKKPACVLAAWPDRAGAGVFCDAASRLAVSCRASAARRPDPVLPCVRRVLHPVVFLCAGMYALGVPAGKGRILPAGGGAVFGRAFVRSCICALPDVHRLSPRGGGDGGISGALPAHLCA